MSLLKLREDHAENPDLIALRHLFSIRRITPQGRMITGLIILAGDHAPTIAEIAKTYGKSSQMVLRWLKEPREMGLITSERYLVPGKRAGKRNAYRVNRELLKKLALADGGE